MAEKYLRGGGNGRTWRERVGVFAPAILLSIAALAVTYRFVQPAPPRHIVIATGPEDGAYHAFGERYRRLLAREGVDATLRTTSGSTENIRLVESGEADIAFVQGGTGSSKDAPTLRSLASLYYEPVWIFVRKDLAIKHLGDLRGRRIAIDREGSGTQPIALALLADNGVGPENATLSPVGGLDALAALRARELDAAFFVIAPGAAVVHAGFAAAGIRLLSLGRGPAYVLQHRFLSVLVLPEGAIDLEADLPPHDTMLLAPAATLVASEDFHPALTELILTIARRIHGRAGVFEQAGDFPSRRYVDFPLSDAAEHFFDSGPPFLQRYLPFWAASLLDRLKILLLPLITLIYPIFKLVPPTYDWRMRSRINRWYGELQTIERRLEAEPRVDLARQLAEVEGLEKTVAGLSVPVAYAEALYNLRGHIARLRDELRQYAGPGRPPL